MWKRLNLWIMLSSALLCLSPLQGHGQEVRKPVALAILPCYDVVRNFKKFHPLLNYLERQTGYKTDMTMPGSLSELEASLRNGSIDFVLQDPHTYAATAELYRKGTLLMALTREGSTSQRGLILARKDSGIQGLADLKGKTVMFGPKLSITKWVAAKEALNENGIDLDKDLKAHLNGGCCEDIAFNVYLRAVDAGVVCDHFLGEHSEPQQELGIDVKQLVVIGSTRPVATRVFAAGGHTDPKIAARIEQALLALDPQNPQHAQILHPAELGGFRRVEDTACDHLKAGGLIEAWKPW